MKWAFVLMLGTAPLFCQPLSVYSEFARIDPQGNVVAPQAPREIISPALIRNGFTSFQIVVQVPQGARYMLTIGQNPGNAAKVMLYRKSENGLGQASDPISAESTEIFWMDVWMDKDAPVRRIKIEPQLYVDGDWLIYPMEMRVRENIVPSVASSAGESDSGPASPFDMLRGYLCGSKKSAVSKNESAPGSSSIDTIDALHRRNALQDLALASLLSPQDRDELRKRMGGCTARAPDDPEFYLRLRDYFVTPLWMKVAHGN